MGLKGIIGVRAVECGAVRRGEIGHPDSLPGMGGYPPPPPGRDCGKWLDPQGFAEGPFGLWQVTETGAVAGAFWQGVWGLPG
jgi:hypothetical protein